MIAIGFGNSMQSKIEKNKMCQHCAHNSEQSETKSTECMRQRKEHNLTTTTFGVYERAFNVHIWAKISIKR